MTPRFVRPCLFVLSLALACVAHAQAPAAAPAAAAKVDDPPVQLKLPDADLDTVLSALEIYTGRTVLRPAGLPTTNYNLKIAESIPKSQAILAIETVLALNNVGIAPLGDRFFVATALPNIRSNAPEFITGSSFDQPASGKVAMKIFQLDFLRIQDVTQMIQSLLNNNIAAPIQALVNANAVVVTESVANLQRIEALLQQIDRPNAAGMKPKFYGPLTNAGAAGVVAKLKTILTGTLAQQLGSATTYQADERTNQIILVTDPRQYPFFDDLIAKLDVKADPNTRNEVIYLKHALALKLRDVLGEIIRGQSSAQQRQAQAGSVRPGQIQPVIPQQPTLPGAIPGAPGAVVAPGAANAALGASEGIGSGSAEFSQLLTIGADERSNSIIVSGTTDDIRLITQLIDKLDTVLAQVRIEVVIAEVTLDDSHSSGISQLGLQISGDRLVGIAGATSGLSLSGSTAADGTASGFASISRIGGPGSLARSLDLTGVLSVGSSPRKNNTTVLSVPSITTSHAKKAVFISSEIRPITTGSTSTPNAANGVSVQQQTIQQDIGITLTVTPLIGSDGSVQLDVDQDVRDLAGTVTINGDDQPIVSHRQTTTTISAKSGDIVVLGGMQRNKDTRQTNRLGPIPILGDLFGLRSKALTRTELIFFLRPYVLTNTEVDNEEMIKRISELPGKLVPQKDEIHQLIDPKFTPPKKNGILDSILPK